MKFNSQGRHGLSRRWVGWAVAMVLLFAIATQLLTRAPLSASAPNSLTGLLALKASHQQAIPYDTALSTPKPTLIEFYADWCTTCQAMAPTISGFQADWSDDINLVMIDIDDAAAQPLINRFNVTGVPHFVVLNDQHQPMDQFIGKLPKSIFVQRITALLAQSPGVA